MVIGEYMTTQNYLMINESTNVVDNICLWDGNVETWQPPANYLMLVQATTPTMIWVLNSDKTDWILGEKLGESAIGFTWNGSVLTTNEPKPNPPQAQPVTEGTQQA